MRKGRNIKSVAKNKWHGRPKTNGMENSNYLL
jgi:hypothetical protein